MSLTEQLVCFYKNNEDFDKVYNFFTKRINFLIYSFHIENYRNDLLVFLWQLVKKIEITNFDSDKALYAYISTCLKNECLTIYKKQCAGKRITYNSDLTAIELDKSDCYNPYENSYMIFDDLISDLSDNQKKIITMRYKYCLSDSEIANSLNISRQAVYKNRKNALLKLQKTCKTTLN